MRIKVIVVVNVVLGFIYVKGSMYTLVYTHYQHVKHTAEHNNNSNISIMINRYVVLYLRLRRCLNSWYEIAVDVVFLFLFCRLVFFSSSLRLVF